MRKQNSRGRGLVLSTFLALAIVCPAARAGWENVGEAGFTDAWLNYISLAFYDGEPYVAYRDTENSNKATVMRYTGGAWQNVGSPGFSAGTANYTSLARRPACNNSGERR